MLCDTLFPINFFVKRLPRCFPIVLLRTSMRLTPLSNQEIKREVEQKRRLGNAGASFTSVRHILCRFVYAAGVIALANIVMFDS